MPKLENYRTLFDRICFGGERPEELPLEDIVILSVASVASPNTGAGDVIFSNEKTLRSLIDREVLPAREIGLRQAQRVHPTSIGLTKEHPSRYPPWADQLTGVETSYMVQRLDVAKVTEHIKVGLGLARWIDATGDAVSCVSLQTERQLDLNQDATEPRMKPGSNSRAAMSEWVAFQAEALLEDRDTAASLAARITDLAANRHYSSERSCLTLESCKRMIPTGLTGGRGKRADRAANRPDMVVGDGEPRRMRRK